MPAAAVSGTGSRLYGDPRDPKVDPVDWVERIPFSETRNYVQRVIENLAVYRVRFDGAGSAGGGEERRARRDAGDERGTACIGRGVCRQVSCGWRRDSRLCFETRRRRRYSDDFGNSRFNPP